MAKPTTKAELVDLAILSYFKLNKEISGLSVEDLLVEFDFSAETNKKEVHWQRDKNLRDILIHLYEWQKLLLESLEHLNENRSFLPEPYNWRNYGQMNWQIWEKHQETELIDAKEMLDHSHQQLLAKLSRFKDEELFAPALFPFTGKSSLSAYFISTMPSHYEWALKKMKAHKKILLKNREMH